MFYGGRDFCHFARFQTWIRHCNHSNLFVFDVRCCEYAELVQIENKVSTKRASISDSRLLAS